MKKEVRLNNVIFPFWMLMLFPQIWLIILPGNFIIDSLVLLCAMFFFKISEKKQWYKKHIFKIYCFGLVSDVIGSAYMLVLMLAFKVGRMGDELYLTLPALLISAVAIFLFNYFISFKGEGKRDRFIMSLIFAIVTAPYTFLIPSSWLY